MISCPSPGVPRVNALNEIFNDSHHTDIKPNVGFQPSDFESYVVCWRTREMTLCCPTVAGNAYENTEQKG